MYERFTWQLAYLHRLIWYQQAPFIIVAAFANWNLWKGQHYHEKANSTVDYIQYHKALQVLREGAGRKGSSSILTAQKKTKVQMEIMQHLVEGHFSPTCIRLMYIGHRAHAPMQGRFGWMYTAEVWSWKRQVRWCVMLFSYAGWYGVHVWACGWTTKLPRRIAKGWACESRSLYRLES